MHADNAAVHHSADAHDSTNFWRTVVVAGLVVGALDGADGAVWFYLAHGLNPLQVFQYIASGALGAGAFQGGLVAAALGGVIHFGLAIGFAGAAVLVYRGSAVVRRHWVPLGLAYGAAVWALMNLVVLPLSAVAPAEASVGDLVNGVVGHALTVGLASLYVARRRLGA